MKADTPLPTQFVKTFATSDQQCQSTEGMKKDLSLTSFIIFFIHYRTPEECCFLSFTPALNILTITEKIEKMTTKSDDMLM